MNYRQKLIQFNATKKYHNECELLFKLIEPKEGERILDYGCGLGTMAKLLINYTDAHIMGHDIYNYVNEDTQIIPEWFTKSIYFPIDTAYFMHSIAHIDNIERMLLNLKSYLEGQAIVITPNKAWLDLQPKEGYEPDPTVFKHYDIDSLTGLFEGAGYKINQVGQFGQYFKGCNERIFLIADGN